MFQFDKTRHRHFCAFVNGPKWVIHSSRFHWYCIFLTWLNSNERGPSLMVVNRKLIIFRENNSYGQSCWKILINLSTVCRIELSKLDGTCICFFLFCHEKENGERGHHFSIWGPYLQVCLWGFNMGKLTCFQMPCPLVCYSNRVLHSSLKFSSQWFVWVPLLNFYFSCSSVIISSYERFPESTIFCTNSIKIWHAHITLG